MSRLPRLLFRLTVLLLVLAALITGAGYLLLRGSLAQLDGELSLPGFSAPVRIERDVLGIVTINAANQIDAARALGYVHGQERFFEMDLLRRSAAGELSELFGKIALEKDKSIRVHRLRARVMENFKAMTGDKLPVLQAYTDGINAGLRNLRTRPWPYLLLRVAPKEWQPADSALAGYAMFFDLQDESNSRELALWKIRQVVPAPLYALLAADGTEWDAPLIGPAHGNVPLPTAEALDLRKLPTPANDFIHTDSEQAAPGSNNFAVAGNLTADHRAIVANDMHLGLRAPNIWFRARLRYDDAQSINGKVDVAGFTLPGIPAVIVGSNTHVAWGFTNSYGDWLDWYVVKPGLSKIITHVETIQIKGEPAFTFPVREVSNLPNGNSAPITAKDRNGTELALDWVAQWQGALNLDVMDLANANDLNAALNIFSTAGMPHQNGLIADSQGRIAWVLTGVSRAHSGNCDRTAPIDDFTPNNPCAMAENVDGVNADYQRPTLIDPANDRLWTANARTLDGAPLKQEGDAGYANGARAKQIRDDLLEKNSFTENDLLGIQLDDRAVFLKRWWDLLREQSHVSPDPVWKKIDAATTTWEGHASSNAVSYRIVREWRLAVIDRIRHGLMAPAMVALGDDFIMPDLPQIEGVAWQLVSQRPAHLRPRAFSSWDAVLLDAAREITTTLEKSGPLEQRRWGERNVAAICHPLAKALPALLKPWLCMPPDALDGDMNMPRVSAPDFGASERMVVSPGHEADGIIHMPGGQSGNPLSPFWGEGQAAWVYGMPTPFLPGKTEHTLILH